MPEQNDASNIPEMLAKKLTEQAETPEVNLKSGDVVQPSYGSDTKKQPQPNSTFGERAVGMTFNPSDNLKVTVIKRMYADIIDQLNEYRKGLPNEETNPDVQRMLSVAITETQAAQMWAVKAVTWQY